MRVAVLGAGGPAGVNTLRALVAAGHECIAYDANVEHLVFCEPYAETRGPDDLIDDVDVAIPQPDSLVRAFAIFPTSPETKTLLPSLDVIERCQDKAFTADLWHYAKLRKHPAKPITDPWTDHLHLAADRFGLPFWLRATRGAGAKGAILVRALDQGYHWLRFWQSRGEDVEWIAEEYLPGRDLAWSSVWYGGELVTSFARERLEYIYPHLSPEGLTGTPTAARTVCDDRVNATAHDAVLAIDEAPHGIYSVDLREDSKGVPRPTEINAGRGFTTFGLWSLYSHNFLDIVVRLARDGRASVGEPPKYDALPEGLTLHRHLDCGHTFSQVREPVAA